VLGFAAQAGVLAGVVALGCLLAPLLPLRQLARNGRRKSEADEVGPPLLRKGDSQTLRQTGLALFVDSATRSSATIHDRDSRGGLRNPQLATALGLGTLAWGLHALADFNSEIPGTVMLAAALPLLMLARTPMDAHGQTRTKANNDSWLAPVGVAVAATVVALVVLAGAAWRLPGEHAYQVACNMTAAPGLPLAEAARLAGWAGEEQPWSPYPWALLGRLAEEQQAWVMAAEAFGRASQRTPHRAAFHDRRARALAALGDPLAAEPERALARLWYPYPPQRR